MLENKNILVGISAGISAYKICELVRMYRKAGANVRVVLTPNALNLVTKLTLETLSNNEVYVNNFEIDEYKPEHIALTESDIFVIAPATANTIGKIANGICDNLLLSTACAFSKPTLIVPAMNTNMWNNPIVQENITKLSKLGYHILEPASGYLACGTSGVGRMREVEEIFDKTVEIMSPTLKGKKILITAGGTREKIDPVRYITNASSGKMGLAIADTAHAMGADVTLVSTFKTDKPYLNYVAETALEMEKIVKEQTPFQDCVIMAAAVSDYRVENYSSQKIKRGKCIGPAGETTSLMSSGGGKYIMSADNNEATGLDKNAESASNAGLQAECQQGGKCIGLAGETTNWMGGECINPEGNSITLKLVENPDILKEICAARKGEAPVIVGFCAESENLIENAKAKIQNKGCDLLIANDISRKDIGFDSDSNEVYIINRELNIKHIEKDTKQNIAKRILEEIFE